MLEARRPGRLGSLVGVRRSRGGPVIFVDASTHVLVAGQIVVIEPYADQRGGGLPPLGEDGRGTGDMYLATVIIGYGQLLEDETDLEPAGRVVRAATDQDLSDLGRREAERIQATSRAAAVCTGLGEGAAVVDAVLSPDAATLTLTLDGEVGDVRVLARALATQFGILVHLERSQSDGSSQAVSGIRGAGMPAWWDEWLVQPGADPDVLLVDAATDSPTVAEVIRRLFPDPIPERRRRRSPGPAGGLPAPSTGDV